MKNLLIFVTAGTSLALLVGCSESNAPQSAETGNSSTNAVSSPEKMAGAVPTTGSNAPVAAQVLNEVAKGADADWGGLVKSLAANHSDEVLNSIGGDLGKIATTLKQSLESQQDLSTTVDSAVRAALADKHSEALALYSKLGAAKLTPEQEKLIGEVKNLTSAFWVQKDLSALDGAQGRVATVVKALRQGDVATALPALNELAKNAALTPQQKELLGTLVKEYAPALAGAAEAVKQKIPELPAVPKPGN
jgi:hypothetical protein